MSTDTNLLMTLLSLVVVQLPVLIAVTAGLVLAVGAPRTAARTGALVGLSLLGASCLLGLALSALPLWLVGRGDFASISALTQVLGMARFALNLADAFGLVLVVWALTRALRQRQPGG